MSKKIMLIIDMQNDFIYGAFGTAYATSAKEAILNQIQKEKIDTRYIFTQDTHYENYYTTLEGKKLPTIHCVKDTAGWMIDKDLAAEFGGSPYAVEKDTFGFVDWRYQLEKYCEYNPDEDEIEICGVCTDICVISNALLLRTFYPEAKISVRADCCAGTSPDAHKAALDIIKGCCIDII